MAIKAAIPVVDLNAADAAANLLHAASTYGFIYIKHHELDLLPAEVNDMFSLSKRFFAADRSIKAECTINSSSSGENRGWLPMNAERLDPAKQKRGDFKESVTASNVSGVAYFQSRAFNIGEFKDGKPQQPLPSILEDMCSEIGDFLRKCHALCIRILILLGRAFEVRIGSQIFPMKREVTNGLHRDMTPALHLVAFLDFYTQYPSLPAAVMSSREEDDIRAGAHSDYGSITLLFRLPHQAGLEILTADGDWAAVPVNPEPSNDSTMLPILVNIGDLLSFWTNGLLKSTVHRVVFPREDSLRGDERYSIVYFCHPQDDAQLVEVPSAAVRRYAAEMSHPKVPNGSPTILTAKDHLNSRLAATYGL